MGRELTFDGWRQTRLSDLSRPGSEAGESASSRTGEQCPRPRRENRVRRPPAPIARTYQTAARTDAQVARSAACTSAGIPKGVVQDPGLGFEGPIRLCAYSIAMLKVSTRQSPKTGRRRGSESYSRRRCGREPAGAPRRPDRCPPIGPGHRGRSGPLEKVLAWRTPTVPRAKGLAGFPSTLSRVEHCRSATRQSAGVVVSAKRARWCELAAARAGR